MGSEWISLKDRKPDPGRNVLVTNGVEVSLAHFVKETRSYWEQVNETTQKKRTEDSSYWNFAEDVWFEVSDWMEKPKPPIKGTAEAKNG